MSQHLVQGVDRKRRFVPGPRLAGGRASFRRVPIDRAALGTNLTIDASNADPRGVIVVPRPFIDPGKKIPSS